MVINIKTKKIQVEGVEYLLKIRLIIGWHKPNLSLCMPNLTVNDGAFGALFYLMEKYTHKEVKCDRLRSDLTKELKK